MIITSDRDVPVNIMPVKALGTFSYTKIKYVNLWQFLPTRKTKFM